jgi:hypothetical protein
MTYATSEYAEEPKPYFPTALMRRVGTNSTQDTISIFTVEIAHAVERMGVQIAQINSEVRSRAYQLGHSGGIALASAATSTTSIATSVIDDTTAFNEFEALRSNDRTIRKLLTRLRATAEIPYRERMAIRIEQLLEAYKEDMEGRVFSADSFSDLIAFLAAARLRYPTVTLTRGGDFYLSWKRGKSHVFSAQFLKTKQCRFVVFRPNERNIGQSEQFSGVTTAHSLLDIVRQFGVADWASE